MKKNRTIATAATALAAAILLAGCGTPEPEKTPTPSASATPTPTPTPEPGDAAPAQEKVDPPTSLDDALQAANKTAQAYLVYNFDLLSNPALGGDYLVNYASDAALKSAEDTSRVYLENGQFVSGGPSTFEPNMGLSYATPISDQSGQTWENAEVILIGCGDNTAMKFEAEPGKTPQAVTSGRFAAQFDVMYYPNQGVWKVKKLSSPQGGPTC